jgi:hypothetical protein
VTPTRPILKPAAEKSSGSVPRKSVRFSLRPGVVPTPKEIDESGSNALTSTPITAKKSVSVTTTTFADSAATATPTTPTSVAPKKRGRPPGSASTSPKNPKKENVSDSLDTTVDEFSRAVQEEEQAEKNGRTLRKSSSSMATTTTTPKRAAKQSLDAKSESAAQMQIVNEILKKNPDLLKDNKVNIENNMFDKLDRRSAHQVLNFIMGHFILLVKRKFFIANLT